MPVHYNLIKFLYWPNQSVYDPWINQFLNKVGITGVPGNLLLSSFKIENVFNKDHSSSVNLNYL